MKKKNEFSRVAHATQRMRKHAAARGAAHSTSAHTETARANIFSK